MIVLYGNPLSTYCAKVRVVMRHKGVAFEDRDPPDGYGSPAYRRIIPMGTIPGFVDGSVVLSESEAIAEYLEETHPLPAMLPGDAGERARIRALSRVHDCWVEPALRALYAHANPERREAAVVEQKVAEMHRRLGGLAELARPAPYLAGPVLTLADCAWPTTLIQAELMLAALGHTLVVPEPLRPWRTTLERHPAVAPGLEPCRVAMAAWLAKVGASPA
ncbi:MAG: glutathione S-transferase family protein [Ectothiorhodospiraceae bacterium]|nr:glutathione S-transferase family protein [Ectothiorhodospiraceae bacterium]